jgi:asparagine N-glycosylation enzyme membrane subunit Stt3
MVALLGGANYALPGPYPAEPLRILVALLVLLGVIAPLIAAVKFRRADALRRAYACYWGAAAAVLGAAFVGTSNAASLGAGSFNYLLTLAPAAGAGVALLGFASARARVLVAVGVAVVGVTNITGVVQGRAKTPLGEIGKYERPLVQLLVDKGVTRGYAGYWDAQNLTWQSGMRVFAAPVTTCDVPSKPLCAVQIFVIASWYREQPGRSFLIVDPTNGFVTTPPPIVREATASYRFGQLRVYVFPYDIARHIALSY